MAREPDRRSALLASCLTLLTAVALVATAVAQEAGEEEGGGGDLVAQGEQLYQNVCAACHQPEGQGVEGTYPALAGNGFVLVQPPDPAIRVVLTGRGGMPMFANSFTNQQVAAVLTYVRQAWGNDAPPVDGQQVQQVRDVLAGESEEAEGGGQRETDEGDDGNGEQDGNGDDGQEGDGGDG